MKKPSWFSRARWRSRCRASGLLNLSGSRTTRTCPCWSTTQRWRMRENTAARWSRMRVKARRSLTSKWKVKLNDNDTNFRLGLLEEPEAQMSLHLLCKWLGNIALKQDSTGSKHSSPVRKHIWVSLASSLNPEPLKWGHLEIPNCTLAGMHACVC